MNQGTLYAQHRDGTKSLEHVVEFRAICNTVLLPQENHLENPIVINAGRTIIADLEISKDNVMQIGGKGYVVDPNHWAQRTKDAWHGPTIAK